MFRMFWLSISVKNPTQLLEIFIGHDLEASK